MIRIILDDLSMESFSINESSDSESFGQVHGNQQRIQVPPLPAFRGQFPPIPRRIGAPPPPPPPNAPAIPNRRVLHSPLFRMEAPPVPRVAVPPGNARVLPSPPPVMMAGIRRNNSLRVPSPPSLPQPTNAVR